MNITGYKKSLKEMKGIIGEEKKKKPPNELKINKLERNKNGCSRKIRLLKAELKKKKGKKGERLFKKIKKRPKVKK